MNNLQTANKTNKRNEDVNYFELKTSIFIFYTDCEVCYEDDDRICSSLGKLDREKKLFTKCGIKEVSTGYEVFFLT